MEERKIAIDLTEPKEELDPEIQTQLKLEINRLIWSYAKPSMTLKEAEELAIDFWERIIQR
jgi:hypothetical protein